MSKSGKKRGHGKKKAKKLGKRSSTRRHGTPKKSASRRKKASKKVWKGGGIEQPAIEPLSPWPDPEAEADDD
jgi:hypothetical protein